MKTIRFIFALAFMCAPAMHSVTIAQQKSEIDKCVDAKWAKHNAMQAIRRKAAMASGLPWPQDNEKLTQKEKEKEADLMKFSNASLEESYRTECMRAAAGKE
jgi:hypothetical protein